MWSLTFWESQLLGSSPKSQVSVVHVFRHRVILKNRITHDSLVLSQDFFSWFIHGIISSNGYRSTWKPDLCHPGNGVDVWRTIDDRFHDSIEFWVGDVRRIFKSVFIMLHHFSKSWAHFRFLSSVRVFNTSTVRSVFSTLFPSPDDDYDENNHA